MKKKILAILLSLSMSFSCIPIYAEEADSTIATSVEDIENAESNETNYNEFTAFPDERIVKVPWGGEKTDFTIIPDETTMYTFESSGGAGAFVQLFNENDTELWNNYWGEQGDIHFSYPLLKDHVYRINAGYMYSSRRGEYSLSVSKGGEGLIRNTLPTTFSVRIPDDSTMIYFFIPDNTGTYSFESFGDNNTYIRIKDEEKEIQAADWDSGEEYNFKTDAYLEKDHVYILEIRCLDICDQPFDVTISCEDITDPDIGPEVPDPGTEPEVPDSDTIWQRVVNLIQEYPDTTPWDTDMYYEWKGGIGSGGYGNEAFAYMASDAIFGNLPARRVEDNIELRNVHPGDILRIENDTRSVIVSETYTDWIRVGEGDADGTVSWSRIMYPADIEAADYMLTRYPEGYFATRYFVAFDRVEHSSNDVPGKMLLDSLEGGVIPQYIPKRFRFEFQGWSLDPEATQADYLPGDLIIPDHDIELYAVWTPKEYEAITEFPFSRDIEVVDFTGYDRIGFKIIPDETTTYTFMTTGNELDLWAQLESDDWYQGVGAEDLELNFRSSVVLLKDHVYYIQIGVLSGGWFSYGSFGFHVSKTREKMITDPVPQTVSVSLDPNDRNYVCYYFKPDKYGFYTFESAGEGNPRFNISDIEYDTWIDSYDSSGEGYFKTKVLLEPDHFYEARFSTREDEPVQYDVSITYEGDPRLNLLQQPQSVSAALGQSVSFHVDAENAVSYQWQYSKDGLKWVNSSVSGSHTDTIKLTVSNTNAINQYRCLLTDITGAEVATEPAFIHLLKPAEIISQPQSSVTKLGEKVTFSLQAENVAENGYQWYYSKDGVKWSKSTVASAVTDTLSMKVSDTNKGNLYRCTITGEDGKKINTDAAGIIVINRQPESIAGTDGKTVSFSVDAENVSSYHWQYTKDGVKWSNSTVSSATTQKLSVKVTDTTKANTYRCKLTLTNGIIYYTDSVRIIDNSLRILKQPGDVTAEKGEKISFSVEAQNVAAGGYQWQYSKDGVKWSKSTLSSAVTDKITLTVSDSNRNNAYRCKLTGKDGTVLYSDIVGIK